MVLDQMIEFWSDKEKAKLASRMDKLQDDKESEFIKIKNKYEETYEVYL